VPDGYLAGAALAPAGLTDRSPEEAWAAALTRAYQDTKTLVVNHPTVVSFYHERGVDVHYDLDDVESVRRRTDLVAGHEQEVVSTDPPRVLVTVPHEGAELRLTVDGELNVAVAEEA